MKKSNERPMCQLCGGPIEGEVYRWNNDDRLPMHSNITRCDDYGATFGMAGFLSRNAAYLNGQGEPVLLPEKGASPTGRPQHNEPEMQNAPPC